MNYSSDYDRFAELRRIQKIEYERVVDEIAKEHCEQPIHSTPIYTDRSTMERKTASKLNEKKLVKKITPNKQSKRKEKVK